MLTLSLKNIIHQTVNPEKDPQLLSLYLKLLYHSLENSNTLRLQKHVPIYQCIVNYIIQQLWLRIETAKYRRDFGPMYLFYYVYMLFPVRNNGRLLGKYFLIFHAFPQIYNHNHKNTYFTRSSCHICFNNNDNNNNNTPTV